MSDSVSEGAIRRSASTELSRALVATAFIAVSLFVGFGVPAQANSADKIVIQSDPAAVNQAQLESVLSKRKNEIYALIDTCLRSGQMKVQAATPLKIELNAIHRRVMDTADEHKLSDEKAIELGHQFDKLAMKVARAANTTALPNIIEIDTLTGQNMVIVERQERPVEIMTVTPHELLVMLHNQLKELKKTAAIANDAQKEQIAIELMRNELMARNIEAIEAEGEIAYLPVAVQHDELGKHIAGVLKAYEFRPLNDSLSVAGIGSNVQ